MPKPVVIAYSADIELIDAPIAPEHIIEGAPRARSARLAIAADRTSNVVAWSCTAGRFTWHYSSDETLYVISGEAFVTDEKGEVRRIGPGDMAYFPAGSRSTWYVPNEIRKIAFCRYALPWPLSLVARTWRKLFFLAPGFSVGQCLLASLDTKLEVVSTIY